MGPFGFNEILIILVIVLLLFGGKKIPELMRGIGTRGGYQVSGLICRRSQVKQAGYY
jgi:TatA/E family protein of Tat protein translocase